MKDHGVELVECDDCATLIRPGKTGLCRTCLDRRRAAPVCDAQLRVRAEAAVQLLRDGERDSAGLLAAVVWPTMTNPAGAGGYNG